jgi:hypothetical protein
LFDLMLDWALCNVLQRDAALREGILDNDLGVIGGVHDVVAPGDALLASPGERDGDLAVMGRG